MECSDATPEYLHRLTHGLRMSIYRDLSLRKDWAELSQAYIKDELKPVWSNLRCASEVELDAGAGQKLGSLLRRHKGSFGTREHIIRDRSRRRFYYCVAFSYNDHAVPLIAYTTTRVLALMNATAKTL